MPQFEISKIIPARCQETFHIGELFIKYLLPRTALSLSTEMSILRDDKMRPLFQEAIVTKLEVTQSTTRYQMKAKYIIFVMMLHESMWVKRFGHHSPAKLGKFPK